MKQATSLVVFAIWNTLLISVSSFGQFHLAVHQYHAVRGTRRASLKCDDELLNDSGGAKNFISRVALPRDADVASVQKTLVQKGIDYDVLSQLASSTITQTDDALISLFERVPGCVATVNVRTILVPTLASDTDSEYCVWLDGNADALLSRGLLALLAEVCRGGRLESEASPQCISAIHVLDINPDQISDLLGLRHVMSKGRNDGLASMVRVIQQQIRDLLQHGNLSSTASTESLARPEEDPSFRTPTVAMLLSGGVDSSVALHLLKQQGYNVTAFYLKIWLENELAHLGQCPWEDDYRTCQAVCKQAGVPLETVSLQKEYKERVISYTVEEAQRGRTPNPDIMCNARVKFGCFYDAIESRGFDFVASGHYAQVEHNHKSGTRRLLRAPDPIKDQSYFLCALTQDQLKRLLFPIGHLHKSEVRELAETFDLPNKHRPDSQGLCFLGKVKFDEFLETYLGDQPGRIVDAVTGDMLGTHRGIWFHTVGQRKGIGKVLDPKATSRGPWYVVAKDPSQNIVFASNSYDEETFSEARSDFYVEDIRWIAGSPPMDWFNETSSDGVLAGKFHMKIRHGPKIVGGEIELTEDECARVRLDQKDGGLAPGQFVVFYTLNDQECLGGGVISERHWAKFLVDRSFDANSFQANTISKK